MARALEEMGTLLVEYTEVIRRLRAFEMTTAGDERKTLGLAAVGIARFLRRQPWRNAAERAQGLALADAADEVRRKCFSTDRPNAQA